MVRRNWFVPRRVVHAGDVLGATTEPCADLDPAGGAYVFVQVEHGHCDDVYDDVSALPGVGRVEVVSGPYDLVVHLDASASLAASVSRISATRHVFRALPCAPSGREAV